MTVCVVTDPALPPGAAYLIGQPYEDWKREQPARADVSFEAWVKACVRRLA